MRTFSETALTFDGWGCGVVIVILFYQSWNECLFNSMAASFACTLNSFLTLPFEFADV